MQISIIVLLFLSVNNLQILLQTPQEACFAIESQKNHHINLHIYSHDKNDYKRIQYFVLDPNLKPILKRNTLNTDQAIVRNEIKTKKDGRYQLCVRQIDHIERFIDVAFVSSAPISSEADEQVTDHRPLDDANFKGVLIDFEKDHEKSQELIEDLDVTRNNHLELVRFMDHQIEIIKEYQYAKVYLVIGIVIIQIMLFSLILKNKEQLSIV